MMIEPQVGWRHIAVTERRTMQDFAQQMKWLVDEKSTEAEVIRKYIQHHRNEKESELQFKLFE